MPTRWWVRVAGRLADYLNMPQRPPALQHRVLPYGSMLQLLPRRHTGWTFLGCCIDVPTGAAKWLAHCRIPHQILRGMLQSMCDNDFLEVSLSALERVSLVGTSAFARSGRHKESSCSSSINTVHRTHFAKCPASMRRRCCLLDEPLLCRYDWS